MTTEAIELQGIVKNYVSGGFKKKTVEALRGVSFQVPKGIIFGLLGPNGAGKTTLIKVLLGLARHNSGEAKIFGFSAGDIEVRKKIGYLPEHHRIPKHHTAYSALEFYGALSNMSLTDIRQKRDDLLLKVGLEGWGQSPVKKFSKGMQQRLGLAIAMLHDPELLILDEPTDGIDPQGRAEVRKIIKKLKEDGKTIFINSHLLQEIELICDKVVILEKGEVKREGTVQELTGQSDSNDKEANYIFKFASSKSDIEESLSKETLKWQEDDQSICTISIEGQEHLNDIIDALRQNNINISSFYEEKHSLEEAFINTIEKQ